ARSKTHRRPPGAAPLSTVGAPHYVAGTRPAPRAAHTEPHPDRTGAMPRLLHLADVHLGALFTAFGDLALSRQAAVLAAFRAVPEVAAAEGAHAVLIAGDLFDRPQPPDAVLAAARETLRRMVDAGLHVFLVPGNHDPVTVHPH